MSLARKGELALVKDIRARFSSRLPGGGTGIGDDAAIIAPRSSQKKLLASVDAMVEGVHFDLSFITPHQLGYKLIAVNASDIYAMGGSPAFVLLSMAFPSDTKISFVERFLDGIEDGLKQHGAALAGGDVSSSPAGCSLSATVLGYAQRPIKRSGARPGHGIFVTGTLGDSAAGLALLKRIGRPVDLDKPRQRPLAWDTMRPLLQRHLMPEPKAVGGAIARASSAMMDLSDGLLLDLSRLCDESGVGAVLEEALLPVTPETRVAAAYLGLDPLRLALSGGEDYVILFTSPRKQLKGAHRIGEVVRGKGILNMLSARGRTKKLAPAGYGHFDGGR